MTYQITKEDVLRARDDVLAGLSDGDRLRLSMEAEAELGRQDTFYLGKYILGFDRFNDSFHKWLAAKYDESLYFQQLHLHPRGHFKTTILTVAGKIRLILLNPNITIGLITNSVKNSEEILNQIRQMFLSNEKFRELYPAHAVKNRGEEGNKNEFTTPARTVPWIRQATISALSIDKRLVSKHFLHLHFDDIVDDDNYLTSDLRRKTRTAYYSALSLCDGKTVDGLKWHHICGTHWHMDDCYMHIIEADRHAAKFKKFITSAYYKTKNGIELLFPEEFSMDILDQIRSGYEQEGSNLFTCLYLNKPVPAGEETLSPEFFKYYDPDDLKGKPLHTVITVDPSATEERLRGDPTIILTSSMDADGNLYLRDIRRGWWNPDEIVDRIVDSHKLFNVREIFIEAVSFSKWLSFFVEKVRQEQHLRFHVEPIKRDVTIKKVRRLDRIVPILRTGKLFIRRDEPEKAIIFKEFREFPAGRYDDVLDTIADAIEKLKPPFIQNSDGVLPFRLPPRVLTGGSKFQTGYSYRRA